MEKEVEFGELAQVELRKAWANEERNFTPWLCKNIDKLSKVINLPIMEPKREQRTGAFEVDIVGTVGDEDKVIIENQIERSNHDHLGKLLTYKSWHGAKYAVWIVSEARPEHVRAIENLNKMSVDDYFYMVEVKLYRIDDSKFAPVFTPVVMPERSVLSLKDTEGLSDTKQRHYGFWTIFIARCETANLECFMNLTPRTDNCLQTKSIIAGINIFYYITIHKNSFRLVLCIDTKETAEENESIREKIYEHKEQIEKIVGSYGMDWNFNMQRDKRNRKITKTIDIGGYESPQEEWQDISDLLIEEFKKFNQAFGPVIKELF